MKLGKLERIGTAVDYTCGGQAATGCPVGKVWLGDRRQPGDSARFSINRNISRANTRLGIQDHDDGGRPHNPHRRYSLPLIVLEPTSPRNPLSKSPDRLPCNLWPNNFQDTVRPNMDTLTQLADATDDDLLLRFQHTNDAAALAMLHDRYSRALLVYAQKHLPHSLAHEADDVVQEAFADFCEERTTFKPGGVSALLYRIVSAVLSATVGAQGAGLWPHGVAPEPRRLRAGRSKGLTPPMRRRGSTPQHICIA